MPRIDLETYQFNQGKAATPGADNGPPSQRASQLSLASQADPSQQFSAYKLPDDDAPAEQQQQLPDIGKQVKEEEKVQPQPASAAPSGLKGQGFEAIHEAHNEDATFED